MESILNDIEKALNARCYYVAVHMTLALPDICAALESPNGQTSGKQYKAWHASHLSHVYPEMTSDDFYSLRCGVVHQGRMGHPNMQYSRAIFTIPNRMRNLFHRNILSDALNLDAVVFCSDIVAAVRRWYNTKSNDPVVQGNLPALVQYRPNGLAPYMGGVPVIS